MEKQTKRPMEDEAIIALYFARDEQAIAETDFKYRNYLYSVSRNILHDRGDCEECLNDTYLGCWNAIPPEKPRVFPAFLTVIARRIAIKRYYRSTRKRAIPSEMTVSLSELDDFIAEGDEVSEQFDAKQLGQLLNGFVRGLPERRQYIFIGRYYLADRIDRIAKELGVSRSTVNKELAAIRASLKEKLESEGYTV